MGKHWALSHILPNRIPSLPQTPKFQAETTSAKTEFCEKMGFGTILTECPNFSGFWATSKSEKFIGTEIPYDGFTKEAHLQAD